jgi:two-component system, OmpR family, response regulator
MDTGKILIIDKNKKDSSSLSRLLCEEGYQVVCADTAGEGIKKAASNVFNLIITDVIFTDITANDLIRRLKKAGKKPLPILILSEQDDTEEIEEFFQQGIDDYIVKPPRISYLLKKIESMVSGGN